MGGFLRLKIGEVSYVNGCLDLAMCVFFLFETWPPAMCYLVNASDLLKKNKGQRNVNSVGRTERFSEFSILLPVGDTDRVGP